MSNPNAAPDRHMNDSFERRARRQESSPTSQFLHYHICQYIGLAHGLCGRRQPTGQYPHICRDKRAHLHSIDKQREMLASGLRPFEITIDLTMIDADLPRQKPQDARRQDFAIR
ncbi:hypothetical protein KGO5_06248 [Sinorhizobium sp. KGO-5]|nr:hypothetical protein KGO5_06248 [Sinorhizobium sp. KGO-5]